MSLKIKRKSAVAIPPVDADTYEAILVGVVDLGEQYNQYYNKYEDRILLIFELPDETVEIDGEQKPRWLSKEFNSSLDSKSNLSKFITNWRGMPFTDDELTHGYDMKVLLGNAGFLSVGLEEGKDGKQYNRINGMSALPKKMPVPITNNELLWFDMDEWNNDVFAKLPGWVQDRIKKSTQYQKNHAPDPTVEVKATETECPI